ncbi:MAG: hypothetical protein VR68_15760 [Peptococcaceae bacterium BRH_c4a]|nr:MAG: hypothetical protein VR68_15760 [Peptococcaceae bacterium BRH_c4a]
MNRKNAGGSIKKEIKKRGIITFAKYMEMALYHPEEGYYMREREKIGPLGDFYTSPDVSPLFGKALADQLEEMWRLAGSPGRWDILEFGAGKGLMARDILEHISGRYPDFFRALAYLIIEKSPFMIHRQQDTLSDILGPGCGIKWLGGLEELEPGSVAGCFLCNELLDAFPVHRVVKTGDDLKEIYVTCENEQIKEIYGELSTPELLTYINAFCAEMEEGQSIEVNLAMREWLGNVSSAMSRGFLLTIDYGDISGRLYSGARPDGTIRSYRSHRLADNLYQEPGEQDITANVNFTALMKWGEEFGLHRAGYAAQMYFLMNLGIFNYLEALASGCDGTAMKETMAVKKLVMPEGMGSVFKVAALYKGFSPEVSLTGFNGRFGSRA